MLPSRYWQKEFLEEIKSKRTLTMKFLLPLLLLSPLAIFSIPYNIKAGGFTAAVLFIGVFGSAVKLVRLRENRMLERLAVLPIPSAYIVCEYILINSFFDGLQLLAPLLIIYGLEHSQPIALLWIFACYIAALLTANALGVLVTLISGTSGEVHLFAFLTVLVVGGLSGLFMILLPSPLREIGFIMPFRHLFDALLYGWGFSLPQVPFLGPLMGIAWLVGTLTLSSRLFRFK